MQKFILFLLLNISFLIKTTNGQAQDNRPNILWITCEDMSADLPGYGNNTVQTPVITRLIQEGIRFTNMYSVSGVCAPSRSAIITGMYPSSIGTHNMRTGTTNQKGLSIPPYEAVIPSYVKCFTEYLRANGYYCTNNAKTDYQFGVPFTAWDESGKKAHWRNRPKDQSFFSVFNIEVTHESQIWVRKDKPLRVDPSKVPLPPYYPDNEIIRKDVARYYDNIMVMDSIAGVLLKQLEEDGLLKNTIVFFFSDHGDGLPWSKRELYDRGIHVPFIVRFPGKKDAGTTNNDLHSFVDLAPTMLSLTETPVPNHLQGQAFLGKNKSKQSRKYVFAARDRMDEWYDMVRAVRDKQFKYIRNYQSEKPNYQDLTYRKQMDAMQEILKLRDRGQLNKLQQRWFETKPKEELYDLSNDPHELTNLAGDQKFKTILIRLRDEHEAWMKEIKDMGFIPENELVNTMWPAFNQPITKRPDIVISKARSAVDLTVMIDCATKGASIAYKLEGLDEPWNIYTKPFTIKNGSLVTAKAIRYGFKPSEVSKMNGR